MSQDFSLDTRQRILEAAAAIFAKRGFRAATVASIAHSAGVNAITVYRHFPKKQQMYWEALDFKLRTSGFVDQMVLSIQGTGTPLDFLNRVAGDAIEGLGRDPDLARLLYFTALELDTEKKMLLKVYVRPLIQYLTSRIDSWIESGETRAMNPEAVALLIVGVVVSYCNLHELFGFTPTRLLTPQEMATDFADICFEGLSRV